MALAAAPEIAGFHALSPLGYGPTSTIYSAQGDALGGRWVALTVYSTTFPTERAQRRFARAFEVARRLGAHPHVATMLQCGLSYEGQPYVATEIYERGTLQSRIEARTPMPVDEVLQLGVQLAGALETAHRAEVVHGGIHPARVLLSHDGEPALADMGLVPLVDRGGLAALVGPMSFHAPPEVLEARPVTPATDVFALASTLYAALAGVAPYQRGDDDSTAMLLVRILHEDIPPLTRDDVPPSLEQALRQALRSEPDDRPARVLAFARELQSAQKELGLPVTEPVVLDVGATLRVASTAMHDPNVTMPPVVEPAPPAEPHRRVFVPAPEDLPDPAAADPAGPGVDRTLAPEPLSMPSPSDAAPAVPAWTPSPAPAPDPGHPLSGPGWLAPLDLPDPQGPTSGPGWSAAEPPSATSGPGWSGAEPQGSTSGAGWSADVPSAASGPAWSGAEAPPATSGPGWPADVGGSEPLGGAGWARVPEPVVEAAPAVAAVGAPPKPESAWGPVAGPASASTIEPVAATAVVDAPARPAPPALPGVSWQDLAPPADKEVSSPFAGMQRLDLGRRPDDGGATGTGSAAPAPARARDHDRDEAVPATQPPPTGAAARALPVIVLVALVVVLGAGLVWAVTTHDPSERDPAVSVDGETTDQDPDDSAVDDELAVEALDVTAVENPQGVQLDWDGGTGEHQVVLVLSETEGPRLLEAETGTALLVPGGSLAAGPGYCFAVTTTSEPSPAVGAVASALPDDALSAGSCIRGASPTSVRRS